jgi:hypothetical protein
MRMFRGRACLILDHRPVAGLAFPQGFLLAPPFRDDGRQHEQGNIQSQQEELQRKQVVGRRLGYERSMTMQAPQIVRPVITSSAVLVQPDPTREACSDA